jgi:hypothetical protein
MKLKQMAKKIGWVLVILGVFFNPWVLENLLGTEKLFDEPVIINWTLLLGLLIPLLGITLYCNYSKLVKRKKEIMLFIFSVLAGVIIIEVALQFINPNIVALGLYDDKHEPQKELPSWARTYTIHPYLGYVKNPIFDDTDKFGFEAYPKTNLSNEFHLVITGGSVALGFCKNGIPTLVKTLQSTIVKNKKITVDCLAHGGWKQPQQLFSIIYLLLNGRSFDLVINIDGFNELSKSDSNINNSVSIIYPDLWNALTAIKYNIQDFEAILKIKNLRRMRQSFKSLLSTSLLRKSNIAIFIERLFNNYSVKRITAINMTLGIKKPKENSPFYAGPISKKPIKEQRMDILEIWADSSRIVEELSSQHGFKYFHFLQPNQYHAKSKPLSKEEIRTAYKKGGKPLIEEWYPKMIARGEKLSSEGIIFFDSTGIFKNETRTLYTDTCCHFNALGYEIYAKFIAKKIVDNY